MVLEYESKWIKKWDEARLFETDPDPARPKYFLTVAYPYPNSPQHIGHARTYTLADVHARYMRMKGFNVLFPMAFHYTGTPILAMSRRLVEGDEELKDTFLNVYGVPKDTLTKFSEPLEIARYFHAELKEGMREMGFSIDWRREFTTIDPHYNKFIEWQFLRLREKGYITQGSHPVGWCSKDGSPVGQHDTLGDVEPEIGEYTLIFFNLDGAKLPCATLRPETIFGVTNLWLNPESAYIQVNVDGIEWIVADNAVQKLQLLGKKVSSTCSIKARDLIGTKARNPITSREVPILPARFVDPHNATGVVMSVPGHAPYDYQALLDLQRDDASIELFQLDRQQLSEVKPLSIIDLEGYGSPPAAHLIDKFRIKGQNDPKLESATSELYAAEFHRGIMNSLCGSYSGLGVKDGREMMKGQLLKSGSGGLMHEILNQPVYCRCGTRCSVKIFESQWFINYADQAWKRNTLECLDAMSLLPVEIKSDFEYTVGWLREKACARGSGMGTRLPWDRNWIIESLSDSVIYMVYYILVPYIKKHQINAEQLKPQFFDYVLLGIGDAQSTSRLSGISTQVLNEIREAVRYFYPLDSRHSGRDLVPNHLTFFIFNHVALFPRESWPRQIVVNGSVLMEGKKMSKSFGNIVPLRSAVRSYGSDAVRLIVLGTAELIQDADVSLRDVKSYSERLNRMIQMAEKVSDKEVPRRSQLSVSDKAMLSKLQRILRLVTDAMDRLRVRESVQNCMFKLDQDIQWYLRRKVTQGNEDDVLTKSILRTVLVTRLKMLAPFAPFTSEEAWSRLGGEGLISTSSWPEVQESLIDDRSEMLEELAATLLDDVAKVRRVTKMVIKRVSIYVAADWKWEAYSVIINQLRNKKSSIKDAISALQKGGRSGKKGEVAEFVAKSFGELRQLGLDSVSRIPDVGRDSELKFLLECVPFFEKESACKVAVYSEDDPEVHDPKGRAAMAKPLRPAFFLE